MLSIKSYRADGLLLLTAMIWGFAFVAQRSGMAFIGPFAYSAVRFALGALVLVPFLLIGRWRARGARESVANPSGPAGSNPPPSRVRKFLYAGLAGAVLFVGASLQQVGLVYTTAANAGFVTCFYVVLVPLVGFFVGRPASWRVWAGALLALVGLYILSVGGGFTMAPGDLLELIGAFVWTGHILLINRLASRMDALEIAIGQFATCAVFSLGAALLFEPAPFTGVAAAAIPILYGGLLSCGIAFTLQIVAQTTAHPARASIIMSMEALFAGIGGVLLLGEPLTVRLAVGGLAMLAGMIMAQLEPSAQTKRHDAAATTGLVSAGEPAPVPVPRTDS